MQPAVATGIGARAAIDTPTRATVVEVTRRGGPEVLVPRRVPVPVPGDGEVLIEVVAAGVAFGDVLLREGMRRVPRPAVPGHEVAGTVVAGGAGTGLSVGDTVVAYTQGTGGYASHVVAPAWAVVPYPPHLDPHAAVALVLNYVTAWQMLTRSAPVAVGSTILVRSAAGGVGSALVQLAVLRGLRVLGTASAGKADVIRALGATPIDYRRQDVAAIVRAAAPDGVDAIYDGLGSASWRASLPLLRAGGRLCIYGLSSGFPDGRRSILRLLTNLARLPRTNYLSYVSRSTGVVAHNSDVLVSANHDWYRADLAYLIDLLDTREIAPVLHRTYPLEQAGQAQAALGSGRATGKITLSVRT